MEISTDARFSGTCPDTGLTFHWSVEIETPSANGRSNYQIDTEGCRKVTRLLKGDVLVQWRNYLANCAAKVREKGNEWQAIAERQLADARILADLASN